MVNIMYQFINRIREHYDLYYVYTLYTLYLLGDQFAKQKGNPMES